MYHSTTGNTAKIAKTLATALNVEAERIQRNASAISESVDILFIGDGIYADNLSKAVISFINKLNPEIIRKAAVFSTYGKDHKACELMTELLKNRGISVVGKFFACKGQAFLFLNRNHPNTEDLKKAKDFALKIVENG